MSRFVEVRTPCRLHFGLTSLGHDALRPQFGGVGVMVDAPGIILQIESDRSYSVAGPLQSRVENVVSTLAEQWQVPALPEVRIEVLSAPREHVGLGVGTQLALAVTAGLAESLGFAWRDPWRLAQLTRRGRRSAVGTYGFLQGGLIIDGGHFHGESLGRLVDRLDVPSDWRFVLFVPTTHAGYAGSTEDRAFAELPPVASEVTHVLKTVASTELMPAARTCEFGAFSRALYLYGSLAGECFSAVQGGTFCSPQTAALISRLRKWGIEGVGQSSWGPSVFALMADQDSANHLVCDFANDQDSGDYEVHIASAANKGASVSIREA